MNSLEQLPAMEDTGRLRLLFLDSDPAVPGYWNPRARLAQPQIMHRVEEPAPSSLARTLTDSSSSEYSYTSSDTSSHSSSSTAPTSISTAPSLHAPQPTLNQQIAMAFSNPNYFLPCEFTFSGCGVMFQPNEFDAWVDHSMSHFGQHPPPRDSICRFCDKEWHASNDQGDRSAVWTERMVHLRNHMQGGRPKPRPDFFLIEYMNAKNLISQDDFEDAMDYTERPKCDGLVEPGSMLYKSFTRPRTLVERVDLAKEGRQMRRERQSKNTYRSPCGPGEPKSRYRR